jgi:hypothetical protein
MIDCNYYDFVLNDSVRCHIWINLGIQLDKIINPMVIWIKSIPYIM